MLKKLQRESDSQASKIKKLRSEGMTVGAIARRLELSLEEASCVVWGPEYRAKLQVFPPNGKRLLSYRSAQEKPTREDFVRWLRDDVNPRLKQLNEWPMGVDEYTYFDSEAVWDVRVLATIEQPSEFAVAHRNGDTEAIFRFAKSNRKALGAKWVLRQLIEWRLTNTPLSKRQFDKFMRAYWSQQGHRRVKTMLDSIEMAQDIFSDSLTWPKGSRVSGLAKKYPAGPDRVKDVLKHYKKAYLRWADTKQARLWLTTTTSSQ